MCPFFSLFLSSTVFSAFVYDCPLAVFFWLITFSRPAEDNPHAQENASDNSSDDNFYSLDDFYANESTPEEETWGLDPDLDLEDFVARAA